MINPWLGRLMVAAGSRAPAVACGFALMVLAAAPAVAADESYAFETVAMDGKRVPSDLPALTMFALLNVAQPWRPDALPIRLDVNELGRRFDGYEVKLSFLSPSDGSGLIVLFRPGSIMQLDAGRANWGTRPFPPEFIDLPTALRAAHDAGLPGALVRAELTVWEGYGPTWRLRTQSGKVLGQFSAVTGERFLGDVTGYVADYNAQWDAAIAGIRGLVGTATAALSPSDPDRYFEEYQEFVCEVTNSGYWSMGSCN